jgi:hypothetical protein
MNTAVLLFVLGGAFLIAGCAKEDDPVRLGSESTTNHLRVYVEGPPYFDIYGTPVPGATIRCEFRDMDHTDPHDDGHLMITEAFGATDHNGRWSCTVTYKETGSYTADVVLVWVNHNQMGELYNIAYIREDGTASKTFSYPGKASARSR